LKISFAQLAASPAPIRILAFLLILGLVWLPLAGLMALVIADPNWLTIAAMSLLFGQFLLLIRWWGRRLHHDRHILQTYGLDWNRRNGSEFLQGLGWGISSLLLLFVVQGLVGGLTWQWPTVVILRVAIEGLLVAIGVGLAEELVFRGWLLDELQRDYHCDLVPWLNAFLFAVLHFLKPLAEVTRTLPQFPGLLLLGLILVWMKRSTQQQHRTAVKLTMMPGRLGLPIGFHAGLVWAYYLLKVGNLITISDRVPIWLTGIDGNPLAGAVGLVCLTGLAFYWQARSR
jgi:hypothetical protein